MRNFKRIVLFGAVGFVLAVLMLQLASCNSSKDLSKSDTQVNSKSRTEDSLRILQLESENAELTRMVREMENLEATFQACPQVDTAAIRRMFGRECPPARIDSFIRTITVPAPSVKRDKDGNLEITGNLAAVKWAKSKLELTVLKYQSLVQTLIENQIKSTVEMTSRVKAKEVHKESSFMGSPWIWLLIGIVIGGVGVWRLFRWMDKFDNAKHFSTNQ